jgi:predicted acylesterase/phospholipase RssA
MKYDLVFEGGGAKGMVFVGALQEFEGRGNSYGRLLGTSAGAITAALVAAGYSAQEMQAALAEKKEGVSIFNGFMGAPAPFEKKDLRSNDLLTLLENVNVPLLPKLVEVKFDDALVDWLANQPSARHIFSFVQFGGWYSADNFLTWLETRMDSGTFRGKPRAFSRMTLDEFHAVTGTDLSVVAADTTGELMLVLNHRTAPACPLVWAVRMSMSIPMLWQEVIWQPEWGKYGSQDIHGHSIVDGGLLSCFPIELFLSSLKDVTDVMGEKASDPVLGLLIDERLPVPGTDQPSAQKTAFDPAEFQTVRRLTGLLNTALSAHDKMVEEAYEKIVVHLPAKGYGTTEFNMSDQRRSLLVAAGRQAMVDYLDLATGSTTGMDKVELARMNRTADRVAIRFLPKAEAV